MRIREIHLEREGGTPADAHVVLPDTGVVLVTGENGAGKSSIAEAVAFALWGTSLRGVPLWEDGYPLTAAVVASDLSVTRAVAASGSKSLTWSRYGKPPVEYDTVTKAQAALDPLVGDWDVWRRAHVFSSSDAATFTGSSDAERKRLLETVLGLTRLDAASALCGRALRAAETQHSATDRSVAALRERLAGERTRRVDALAVLAENQPDTDPVAAQQAATAATKRARAVQDALAVSTRARTSAANALADAQAKQRLADAAVQRLSADACPLCAQPIAPAVRERLRADVTSAAARSADAAKEARAAADRDEQERARLEPELESAQQDAANAWAAERNAQTRRQAYDRATAHLATVDANLAAAEDALCDAGDAASTSARTVAVLTAADAALGLKGARARLLAGALAGIEATANRWLGRVAGAGLFLVLAPWTEKTTGGVRDAIRLDVHGAGGGRGYRGASGGQRRRIDVALLLALGEVVAAAHGGPPTGTLFFDEVFDALDSAGVDAVCGVIAELSQTRACVVISHNQELQHRLRPTVRLRARNGHVEEL